MGVRILLPQPGSKISRDARARARASNFLAILPPLAAAGNRPVSFVDYLDAHWPPTFEMSETTRCYSNEEVSP